VQCGELAAIEHATFDAKSRQRHPDIVYRLGQQSVAAAKERSHLTDSCQLLANPLQVIGGPPISNAKSAQASDRMRRYQIEHAAELDRRKRIGALLGCQWERGAALTLGWHPVGRPTISFGHHPA
jgi:hypothetical protein